MLSRRQSAYRKAHPRHGEYHDRAQGSTPVLRELDGVDILRCRDVAGMRITLSATYARTPTLRISSRIRKKAIFSITNELLNAYKLIRFTKTSIYPACLRSYADLDGVLSIEFSANPLNDIYQTPLHARFLDPQHNRNTAPSSPFR